MRSAEEIREHLLKILYWSLRRPGMYGQGTGLEFYFRDRLELLCFIDEQDEKISQVLESKGYWSSRGVYGVLEQHRQTDWSVEDHLASIYAELAYLLGYFQLERTLTNDEWINLKTWCDANLQNNHHHKEIVGHFGKPSFAVLNLIQCYSTGVDGEWVTFSFDRFLRNEPGVLPKPVYQENPILREVRFSATDWRWTPFGLEQLEKVQQI